MAEQGGPTGMLPFIKGHTARLLLVLMGLLPLGGARRLAAALGALLWHLNGRDRRVAQRNLELAMPLMPAGERATLCRRALVETCATITEMPLVWKRSGKWHQSHNLGTEGLDLLGAEGDSVLVLVPHLGNWEYFGRVVSERRHGTLVIYKAPRLRQVEAMMVRGRQFEGTMRPVPAGMGAVLAITRALRNGGCAAILPDQESPAGIFVPFFGVPALTMTLIHKLVQSTKCRVVMGTSLRAPGGFQSHIINPDDAIYSADQSESLTAMNRSIESMVALAPAQYQWAYKRYGKHPPGTPPRYPR